jgi:hypothetical protein
MQISGVSLTLPWPPEALFTQSFPVHKMLLEAFPFPCTLGEVTLHLLSQACMFIYSSSGRLSPSPVEFSSLCHSHKLSCSWLLVTPLLLPKPLQPGPVCLFTVPGRIPLPPSFELRASHPLCQVSLLFLLLITQFLFFPRVGVGLSRGLC